MSARNCQQIDTVHLLKELVQYGLTASNALYATLSPFTFCVSFTEVVKP